jgi:hypothetical protein
VEPPRPRQQSSIPAQPAPARPLDPLVPLPRGRTPPSEDVDVELLQEVRAEPKAKAARQKSVGWKEKEKTREAAEREREKEKQDSSSGPEKTMLKPEPIVPVPAPAPAPAPASASLPAEPPLGQVLGKEMKKLEENLNTRLGKLVGKELDKQRKQPLSFKRLVSDILDRVALRGLARERLAADARLSRQAHEGYCERTDQEHDSRG